MSTIELPDGRVLGYEEWGDPDGLPLFSLHGTPGCRLTRTPDATLWARLQLRVVTVDRAGYGLSSPLVGRRVGHAAGDIAALADVLGIGRFAVSGVSGGGPHSLACAAELGDRVLGCVAASSAAHVEPDEVAGLIAINRESHRVFAEEGRDGITRLITKLRDEVLAQPTNPLTSLIADAPSADQEWDARSDVRAIRREAIAEALRPGPDGWIDDSMSLFGPDWGFDPSRITCPTTFWHSTDDANSPITAVERLRKQIPGARLRTWQGEGHSAAARNLEQILRALLDDIR
ncbi:MAG TPA: alpha/beta hydrolase [Pseudonocardiaceae bacterium]